MWYEFSGGLIGEGKGERDVRLNYAKSSQHVS